MKCVCALFILVLVVQIVHTKMPRLTSTGPLVALAEFSKSS